MCKPSEAKKKGDFRAKVVSNRPLRRRFSRLIVELTGDGAEAFGSCKPGQFAQLDVSNLPLPPAERIPEHLQERAQRRILLRRPFSFSDVQAAPGVTRVEILYCVLGPATLRMTTLRQGDELGMLGPLGNGFSVPQRKRLALLVAGGMGAPPLLHLAKVLAKDFPQVEAIAFGGARTMDDLPFKLSSEHIRPEPGCWLYEFTECGTKSVVATEDGSAGFAGTITECFSRWLDDNRVQGPGAIIYACGPEAMLAELATIAETRGIDCQVSLERMMACGIGVCQSCAVQCKDPQAGETVYKLCCKDGPVFDSREVVWKQR